MTPPQDMDRVLSTWLRDVPPHSDQPRARAVAQAATTPQRRRRPWWLQGPPPPARPSSALPGARRTASFSVLRVAVILATIALVTGLLVIGGGPTPAPDPTPAPTRTGTIASSAEHVCAVIDGRAWCWGSNTWGQLGDGTMGQSAVTVPVQVRGLHGVTAVATGDSHSCAVADGRAWCWGGRSLDGGPPASGATASPTAGPTLIPGLEDVTSIGAGGEITCAVADGQVWCWGLRILSGDDVPIQITGLSGVTAISVGGETCAIAGGRPWCWGGPGTDGGTATLAMVPGLDGVTEISAGATHTCALAAGRAWCWGELVGQLGDGTTSTSSAPLPAPVVSDGPVTAVSAGSGSTCVVAGGAAWCWGVNEGQLGDPSLAPSLGVSGPVRVAGLNDVTAIVVGGQHTCAIVAGRHRCWGANWAGQLGDGLPGATAVPVLVGGFTDAAGLGVGPSHACALDVAGVWCWGHNDDGQLGDGTTADAGTRVLAVGTAGATLVSAGSAHTCAVIAGEAWCWGRNDQGQLGDGSRMSSAVPLRVEGLRGVSAISAAGSQTCAIASDRAWCWGANRRGQAGDGTMTEDGIPHPVQVAGVVGSTAIAASGTHACALVGGAVWCWGRIAGAGWDAPEGTDVSPLPMRIVGLDGVTDIGVGGEHTCAVMGGQAWCWGGNWRGQTGTDPISDEPVQEPRRVEGIEDVRAIAAGTGRTCAIVDDAAWCWGGNEFGALGMGTMDIGESTSPVRVIDLEGVTAIALAGDHTCAIARGQVACWGSAADDSRGPDAMS